MKKTMLVLFVIFTSSAEAYGSVDSPKEIQNKHITNN